MFYGNIQIKAIEKVQYIVLLDGEKIATVGDYLTGSAMCLAWRKNNPREPKKRIALRIVPLGS